jgi:hypothetical protein
MRARKDSLSVAELEAQGYEVVHVDIRYSTRLMRRWIPPRNDGTVRSAAIILLLAAFWISFSAWVGVRCWSALVDEARIETAPDGER